MAGTEIFDAVIIGSGQAGNPLALALANQKWKVALVEKGNLGGTCVNTGCTPTKMYVASARRMWAINTASELGITIPNSPKLDLKAVKTRKNNLIEESRKGIEKSLQENAQITLIRGTAEFIDAKRIHVGSRVIEADKFFINVGARPVVPEGFESVEYLTNESILELEEVPKELIVLGGSYIGLEFAQMFARFGSKVTIIESSGFLISKEDEDISSIVQEILEAEGVEVFCSAEKTSARKLDSGAIAVNFEVRGKTKMVSGSHLLLAVGRKPNSDLIHAEKAGLETDKKGYIKVNSKLETNVAGIYALGDCNGEGAFTHTAYHDFEILKNQLFDDQSKTLEDRVMNYALYIDPPMGRVGMTKKQAIESGKEILHAAMPMSKISRAKEKGETQGKMAVVIDAKTEKILGATVLGTGGDEIIGTFITAIYADASYKSLMNSIQTHPTVTELIPTLLQNLKPLGDSL